MGRQFPYFRVLPTPWLRRGKAYVGGKYEIKEIIAALPLAIGRLDGRPFTSCLYIYYRQQQQQYQQQYLSIYTSNKLQFHQFLSLAMMIWTYGSCCLIVFWKAVGSLPLI